MSNEVPEEIRTIFAGAGWDLARGDWAFFHALRERIVVANRRMNLTRITEPRDFFLKHVLDSLLPFSVLPELRDLPPELRMADLGSGAGFPGLALARMRPDWEVALLERTRKKAEFLAETAAGLELPNVLVFPIDGAHAAAEAPVLPRTCDLVCARAVGRITGVTRSVRGLLRPGGFLVHYKGGSLDPEERRKGRAAAGRFNLEWHEPVAYELPPEARRSVVLMRKPESKA